MDPRVDMLIGVKKTVAVSAYGITPYVREVTGVPINPSYIPGPYTTYSDEMTFWERLDNFKLKVELEYRSLNWERETLDFFHKVYPDSRISGTFSGAHPNIYRMKWIPQMDLLADKRLSLFITHAGMNSVVEATFAGKPMVVIPLFGDQFLNAKNTRRGGRAVMIDRSKLNKDVLVAAIRETLSPNA
ncbi:hypothetical protein TELCIR_05226 [Teladorsagia circumcincta]|uniref:glucuronosyltransferase n=1 Tax=Teladorsagia circumcincta TaxID=45464 RepID=A0A2G9URF2_TELCI|nr:hypothetical protein TELCIR_05226 [Teladorsagia circumcincta]